MLLEDQIEFIRAVIDNSSITNQEVRDDLLDHFCCTIEDYMQKGFPFEAAYELTFIQVCPNGLNQIQEEFIILANFTKVIGMNQLKYLIGLMASIGISMGSLFKLMHWPGADNILIVGLVGFILVFIPMLAYEKYKRSVQWKSENLKDLLGFASSIVLGIGFIFKISHLTGAGFIMVGGTILFALGFLPVLFLGMYKKSLKQKLTNMPF